MLFSKTHLLAIVASTAAFASATPNRHRRDVVCYFEIPAESGDTCDSLSSSWGISMQDFVNFNPGVTCPGPLQVGKPYCVIGEYTPGPTSSTSSTTSTTTTTTQQTSTTSTSSTAPPPEPTNSPQMPGIIPTCDRFYKVQSGDTCDAVASRNGITVAQLRSWNSEINASCSNLWVEYYICVHVPGAAPPPTSTTSAPQPTNSPTLPGAVNNCNNWYKIVSGDSCDTVAAKNKITVAQLRSFNTQINSSCNNLLLGYFACVGVPGMATPMPDIVSNCSRFSQVVSGDTCDSIAAKNSITVANFKRWNPYINASCSNLWLNALVCTRAP